MSGSKSVSTKEQRIAEVAKNAPDMAMDVSHHLDLSAILKPQVSVQRWLSPWLTTDLSLGSDLL
ncbi:MAG: hypothetical protein GY811_18525 [Myxococcales bacterium]|nr:hypothetical protein [Myxococcales bacterium]